MATKWTGNIDGDLAKEGNYDSAVSGADTIAFSSANLTGAAASPTSGTFAGGTVDVVDLTLSGCTFPSGTVVGFSGAGTITGSTLAGCTLTVDNGGSVEFCTDGGVGGLIVVGSSVSGSIEDSNFLASAISLNNVTSATLLRSIFGGTSYFGNASASTVVMTGCTVLCTSSLVFNGVTVTGSRIEATGYLALATLVADGCKFAATTTLSLSDSAVVTGSWLVPGSALTLASGTSIQRSCIRLCAYSVNSGEYAGCIFTGPGTPEGTVEGCFWLRSGSLKIAGYIFSGSGATNPDANSLTEIQTSDVLGAGLL